MRWKLEIRLPTIGGSTTLWFCYIDYTPDLCNFDSEKGANVTSWNLRNLRNQNDIIQMAKINTITNKHWNQLFLIHLDDLKKPRHFPCGFCRAPIFVQLHNINKKDCVNECEPTMLYYHRRASFVFRDFNSGECLYWWERYIDKCDHCFWMREVSEFCGRFGDCAFHFLPSCNYCHPCVSMSFAWITVTCIPCALLLN